MSEKQDYQNPLIPFNLQNIINFIIPGATCLLCIFMFELTVHLFIVQTPDHVTHQSVKAIASQGISADINSPNVSDPLLPAMQSMAQAAQHSDLTLAQSIDLHALSKERKAKADKEAQLALDKAYPYHLPIYSVFAMIGGAIAESQWMLWVAFTLGFILWAYLIGHVISAIASFIIERILVKRVTGYPYELILGFENAALKSSAQDLTVKPQSDMQPTTTGGSVNKATDIQGSNASQRTDDKPSMPYPMQFWRGLFFWMNIELMLYYCSHVWHILLLEILFIILAGYVILNVVVVIIYYALDYLRRKPVIQSPSQKRKTLSRELFSSNRSKAFSRFSAEIARKRYFWFAWLFNFLSNILSYFVDVTAPLSPEMRKNYHVMYKKAFAPFDPAQEGTMNYWLCRAFIREHSTKLNNQLRLFYNLYIYARNTSVAFAIAFIYSFRSLLTQLNTIDKLYWNDVIKIIPALFFLLSMFMLARFYNIYYIQYNRTVFRGFIYLNIDNSLQLSTRKSALNPLIEDIDLSE